MVIDSLDEILKLVSEEGPIAYWKDGKLYRIEEKKQVDMAESKVLFSNPWTFTTERKPCDEAPDNKKNRLLSTRYQLKQAYKYLHTAREKIWDKTCSDPGFTDHELFQLLMGVESIQNALRTLLNGELKKEGLNPLAMNNRGETS